MIYLIWKCAEDIKKEKNVLFLFLKQDLLVLLRNIVVPQTSNSWDYSHVPPRPARLLYQS